jgi:hypothetical protein
VQEFHVNRSHRLDAPAASLEGALLLFDALAHVANDSPVFATQTLEFLNLLGEVSGTCLGDMPHTDHELIDTLSNSLLQQLPALTNDIVDKRFLEIWQVAGLQQLCITVNFGHQAFLGRHGNDPGWSD